MSVVVEIRVQVEIEEDDDFYIEDGDVDAAGIALDVESALSNFHIVGLVDVTPA
jgi:hypothetical protein